MKIHCDFYPVNKNVQFFLDASIEENKESRPMLFINIDPVFS